VDVSEYAYDDIHLAVDLARADPEYWGMLRDWIERNTEDLTTESRAYLFEAVACKRPTGNSQPKNKPDHAKLGSITNNFCDIFGFALTRNEASTRECVTSILSRLEIDGKAPSERSLENILKSMRNGWQTAAHTLARASVNGSKRCVRALWRRH
jgi:hypothetical protein